MAYSLRPPARTMTVSCRLAAAAEEEEGCVRAGEGDGRTVTPFGAAGNGDDEATNNHRHGFDEDVAKFALGAFRRRGGLAGYVHSIALISVDLRPGRNELIAHNAGRNWHLPRGTNIRTGRGIYPA